MRTDGLCQALTDCAAIDSAVQDLLESYFIGSDMYLALDQWALMAILQLLAPSADIRKLHYDCSTSPPLTVSRINRNQCDPSTASLCLPLDYRTNPLPACLRVNAKSSLADDGVDMGMLCRQCSR